MKEHKTLLKLLQKAYDKGEANQNGRQIEYDFGRRYIGELESKFYAKITDDGVLELQHWGTTILVMTETEIEYAYAESKSDVDLIKNAIWFMTGQEYDDVHYYPSTDKSFIGGKEITYGETVNIAL